jgi:diadenosine tetraphosphate (Ap4A) HIT family hydrolase
MTEKQSIFTTLPEIKERSVAENETAWAFLTNIPITPGHTLVSPKRVVETVEELTETELIDIFALAAIVKNGLRKVYGAEGFNCAWNEGKQYGQSVPHFHLHVVPRTPGDDGITEYDPRKFLYRPGSRENSPEAELAAVAKELKDGIDSLNLEVEA